MATRGQPERLQALADFKSGKSSRAGGHRRGARGLDIEDLPHVVNFELPGVPGRLRPSHRPHRPGRASGEAISLVCAEEHERLDAIEKNHPAQHPEEDRSGIRARSECRALDDEQAGRPA